MALTVVCALSAATTLYAKSINLYDQPKADSKVVGTLDSNNGMVLVFAPKGSDWIKVADPKNGNVGWIMSKDAVDDASGAGTSLSVTQQTIQTGSGPKSYQVVKFGTTKPMSDAQHQAMVYRIQQEQMAVQQSIQKMMQQFYQQMNTYYQSNPAMANDPNEPYPIIMPVVVFPVSGPPPVANKTTIQSPFTPLPVMQVPEKK